LCDRKLENKTKNKTKARERGDVIRPQVLHYTVYLFYSLINPS
jgi:hypothetical protein